MMVEQAAKVWEAFSYLEGRSSVAVSLERGKWGSIPPFMVIKGGARIWELSHSRQRPVEKKWRVAERRLMKRHGAMVPNLVGRRYFATAKEAADYLIGELRGDGL